jgi:cobalt-zinc-cadmium efflux system protein
MSTTESALTAHLIVPGGPLGDSMLREIAHELEDRFGIHHTTIQVEQSADHCHLHH